MKSETRKIVQPTDTKKTSEQKRLKKSIFESAY